MKTLFSPTLLDKPTMVFSNHVYEEDHEGNLTGRSLHSHLSDLQCFLFLSKNEILYQDRIWNFVSKEWSDYYYFEVKNGIKNPVSGYEPYDQLLFSKSQMIDRWEEDCIFLHQDPIYIQRHQ